MSEQLICSQGESKKIADAALWMRQNATIYNLPLADLGNLRDLIDSHDFSLWRYRSALPFGDTLQTRQHMSLGEGGTALVDAGSKWPGLMFKLEYAMPTLSFKDRGAVVMIAKALEWGVQRIVADSSGNAGTSIAAYSAKAGIECDIFVPAYTSVGKLIQIEMHGATCTACRDRVRRQRRRHSSLCATMACFMPAMYLTLIFMRE